MSYATLRYFSLAEQCHTQKFYLRCFNSNFDAVKANLVYSLNRLRRRPQIKDNLNNDDDLKNEDDPKNDGKEN